MDIKEKVAIVTGASAGIGAAFSQALVQKGATVYGLARSSDKLKSLQRQFGDLFIPITMDITDQQAVTKWVDKAFPGKHLPDILINNAGLGRFGDVDELPVEDWEAMIHTNLSGTFYITRKVVPLMKRNENTCHIVNIASIASKVSNPQLSGYNASKFGVRGFSDALFKELRYDKIKVTCFNPGSIATDFFKDPHDNMMQPQDVAQVLINILETPDNFLIDDITMRPLNPKPPAE